MNKHTWLRDVILDLEEYARANDLPDDLVKAVASAAKIATEQLPVIHTDFTPKLKVVGPHEPRVARSVKLG